MVKILCPHYKINPDYNGPQDTCSSCVYLYGTKCEDLHKALAQEEDRHNSYKHMMNNRHGIHIS